MNRIITFQSVMLLMGMTNLSTLNAEVLPDDPLPSFDCLIEPGETVEVGSPAPGIIDKIFAERGDVVALGAPLAKLNSAVEEAAVELARSRANSTVEIKLLRENVEFSKRLYSRNQELFSKSAISSFEMDRLETEQSVAEMKEQQAQSKNKIAQLEYNRAVEVLKERTIRNPIKGVVIDRYKSVGEYVENEPLMRVAQLDPLRIEIFVTADYWGRLAAGQQAQVTPFLMGLDTELATIERIDPIVDSASGTFRVQLRLPNPKHQIAAGLKCELVFLPQQQSLLSGSGNRLAPSSTSDSASQAELAATVSPPALSAAPLSEPAPLIAATLAEIPESRSSTEPQRCFAVGPLADENIAQKLSKQLNNQSLELTMKEESRSVGDGYVVQTRPYPELVKVRALVKRIKAINIKDFYVATNKEKKHHRIILGRYQNRKNAIRRVKALASKGFDVEYKPRYQDSKAFWLNVAGVFGMAGEQGLRSVVSDHQQAEIKPVACEQLMARN